MQKIFDEKGNEAEMLKTSEKIEDMQYTLRTFAYVLKYKKSDIEELSEISKPEVLEKAKADFIINKMKKNKGVMLQKGDFDTHYELFKIFMNKEYGL